MGCFPFCCFFKNIGPKKYAGTAIACNIFKLGISIGSFFIIKSSIVEYALYLNILELVFTVVNLILLSFVIFFLVNGKIFDKYNKRGKILCIFAIIFSAIIIMSRIATFVLVMIFYRDNKKWLKKENKKGPSMVNYLFKLIKLHSNVSYSEYKKSGQFVGEVSIHGSNNDIKNPQIFPYNNPSTESSQ